MSLDGGQMGLQYKRGGATNVTPILSRALQRTSVIIGVDSRQGPTVALGYLSALLYLPWAARPRDVGGRTVLKLGYKASAEQFGPTELLQFSRLGACLNNRKSPNRGEENFRARQSGGPK